MAKRKIQGVLPYVDAETRRQTRVGRGVRALLAVLAQVVVLGFIAYALITRHFTVLLFGALGVAVVSFLVLLAMAVVYVVRKRPKPE